MALPFRAPHQYSSLKSADDEEQLASLAQRYPRDALLTRLLWISAALNVFLMSIIGWRWVASRGTVLRPYYLPDEVYSPALPAVEYKTVVFKSSLHGGFTDYQGSSDEVNARWEALYNTMAISQISADQAAKLPNATTPTAWDSSQYMVELDVFHQLHCLNALRKLVYPREFPMDLTSSSDEALDNVYHLEHCYDQLRQSLECSADISTIYWEWSSEKRKMLGSLETTHTCRDFDRIREWALDHQLQGEFDWWQEVDGAPIKKPKVGELIDAHNHMHGA